MPATRSSTRLAPAMRMMQQAPAVELAFASDLRGLRWGPHGYAPKAKLSRVEFTSPMELPPPTETDDDGIRITLTEHVYTLKTSDLYSGKLDDGTRLSVRVLNLDCFAVEGDPSVVDFVTRPQTEEYIAAQPHIHKLAAGIPGVAKLGGVFAAGPLHCLVYEDFGRRLTMEERKDTDTMLPRFTAIVEALIAVGVGPWIRDWWALWIGPDNQLKVVDFVSSHILEQYISNPQVLKNANLHEKKKLMAEGALAKSHRQYLSQSTWMFRWPNAGVDPPE